MLFLNFKLILILITVNADAQLILLHSYTNFKGATFVVNNISKCSNLPNNAVDNIMSIDTTGNCAKLFDSLNCRGNSIEVLARSPSHYDLSAWKFGNKARSVGPCRDSCDERVTGYNSWEKPPQNGITLFTEKDFEGEEETVNVNGCTLIPEKFVFNLSSVYIGDALCIQLYNNEKCQHEGPRIDSIELRQGTPSHNNISNWGFKVARAISHCNYKCNRKNRARISNLESGNVVLFDEINFRGYWLQVKLEQCVNLLGPWESAAMSIKIASRSCVMLYNKLGCDGDYIFILESSLNLSNQNFSKMLKSIRPCYLHSEDESTTIQPTELARDITAGTAQSLDNEHPGLGEVMLFDEKYFKGNWLQFKLQHCVNLLELWVNNIASFKLPKGSCIALYSKSNCTGNFLYAIDSSPDLFERGDMVIPRSMQPCNKHRHELYVHVTPPQSIINKTNETVSQLTSTEESPLLSMAFIGPLVAIPMLFLLLAIFIVVIVIRKYKPYKKLMDTVSERELQEFLNGLGMDLADKSLRDSGSSYSAELLAKNKPYNAAFDVPRSHLKYDERTPIGVGEFGVVYKGVLTSLGESQHLPTSSTNVHSNITVAVKTLRSDARVQSLRNLLKEVKIMMYVGEHENVIQLVGCCTEDLRSKGEILVLVEYCVNGSLESFLRKSRENFRNFVKDGEVDSDEVMKQEALNAQSCSFFDVRQLLRWCLEIAKGMEFLASKKVIHSDLAGRNILLDDNLRAKISDFGLSKQLYCYTQYAKKHQEPLPWRWMALESLKDMEFSTLSDVWGYGVLCWEIFTLGEKPFPGIGWSEDFMQSLDDGLRLRKPAFALTDLYVPNNVKDYNLMTCCWDKTPQSRPTFSKIVRKISKMAQNVNDKILHFERALR